MPVLVDVANVAAGVRLLSAAGTKEPVLYGEFLIVRSVTGGLKGALDSTLGHGKIRRARESSRFSGLR